MENGVQTEKNLVPNPGRI
jgi:hypothetical protein